MARGENALIAVAGAPTAVTNNAIAGILDELGQSDHISEIYGALAGLAGALDGRLVDLGAQKRKTIEGLRRTPGSVLGARVRYLGEEDAALFVASMKNRGIGTLFLIGGLPAIELAKFAKNAAKSQNYPLSVLVVPASPENEITAGDHCVGYGSAARAAAVAARDGARGAQGGEEPLVVLEIGGAGAGWLAAATALARDEMNSAPHSILLPERPVDVDELIEETRRATQKFGYALLVTTDGAQSKEGDQLNGPALADILADRLNLPSRWDKIGLIASVSGANIARADADEAYNLGALVARLSAEDASGYVVALNRADEGRGERGYKVVEASLRLEQVEEYPRTLPDAFISASGTNVTEEFLEWARPLLGGALPEYATLG
ncbi:pyrophosphate--fructose 6-phosphate 1-phosphotransferase [Abditibacteriota bacterium]|nr:pyrophosphate--fructose 6-phosphate 1-phosphotransferase [Abditibacteriota bacterium]